MVPSSCFHAGFFLLRTLRPIAEAVYHGQETEELEDSFGGYVDDFCIQYMEVIPRRTQFVRAVNGIEDATDF